LFALVLLRVTLREIAALYLNIARAVPTWPKTPNKYFVELSQWVTFQAPADGEALETIGPKNMPIN
jgi:hypothetical protein